MPIRACSLSEADTAVAMADMAAVTAADVAVVMAVVMDAVVDVAAAEAADTAVAMDAAAAEAAVAGGGDAEGAKAGRDGKATRMSNKHRLDGIDQASFDPWLPITPHLKHQAAAPFPLPFSASSPMCSTETTCSSSAVSNTITPWVERPAIRISSTGQRIS